MGEWLTPGIFARAISHLRDLPAVLRMALQELAIPAFQTRSLQLEQRIGLALFCPAFAFATLRLLLVRGRDRFALGCSVTAMSGILMYPTGYWLFPYQNLADLRDNWLFVMDRQLVCLIPLATYVIARSISGIPPIRERCAPEQPLSPHRGLVSRLFDRGGDDLPERGEMNIGKPFDVETDLGSLVFPQLQHHGVGTIEIQREVKSDVLPARGERDLHPVQLTAIGILQL